MVNIVHNSSWKSSVFEQKSLILDDFRCEFPARKIRPVNVDSWNAILHAWGEEREYCIKIINEKTHPVNWNTAELDYIGQSLIRLENLGFGYIEPAYKTGNGSYAFNLAGYKAMVFPWAKGADRVDTDCDISLFVKHGSAVLTQFHIYGREVAEEMGPRESSWTRMQEASHWRHNVQKIWRDTLKRATDLSIKKSEISMLWAALQKYFEVEHRYAEFFSPAPHMLTLLHGDYRPENVQINGDNHVGLFDFDFIRRGLAEEDVAYAALYCATRGWFTGMIDWTVLVSFVLSYQENVVQCGTRTLQLSLLQGAFYWTILKEILLFRLHEDIHMRIETLEDMSANLERCIKGVC